MFCLIAAEPQAAEVIKRNLEKSGRYPGWRFETVTGAEELERWPEQPDVLVVSRFLPGKDPVALLKPLRATFPTAHVVLLAGQASEGQRAYVRAAEKLGFHNVVTGKLPGDPPYTIFTALTQAKRPELEGYGRLGEEEEVAEAVAGPREEEAPVEPRPPVREAVEEARPAASRTAVREVPPLLDSAPADLRSIRDALEAGDLDALRERLAGVLAALEEGGTEERMERVSDRRGVLVLSTCNKGGTGKTTVAAALSRALARAGVPTVAVDLDLKGPSLAATFGLKEPEKLAGIDELAGRRIYAGAVRDLIVPVSGGLDLLPGCREDSDRLKPEEVNEILALLREMYGVVVADTGAGAWGDLRGIVRSPLAGAFEAADYVLAVVNQSVQNEAQIKKFGPALFGAGVRPERIGIVINQYSPRLHNPRVIEQLFCQDMRGDVKVRPRVVAVIPQAWDEFNIEAYKGTVPGLDDPAHAWHKLAEKIAAMAGYSYRGAGQQKAGRKGGEEKHGRRSVLDIFRRR